jgi:DNA mismatch repair protein MutS
MHDVEKTFSTPMMQQYMTIKKQYPDCLLFFRLGDFYELFLDDALIGAQVLQIVLTRRPRGKDGDIPMAGVPYHASAGYIAKLVKAGHKIAICEQITEPNARGIVEREVVRIVTPGTILDEKTLDAKEHNYTMSIALAERTVGLAFADISTGDFLATEIAFENVEQLSQSLLNEIARLAPAECIVHEALYNNPVFLKMLAQDRKVNITKYDAFDEYAGNMAIASKILTKHFKIKTLSSFGLREKPEAIKACGALFGYLSHTQKNKVEHITSITTYEPSDHVVLDASTIANLELFRPLRENEERGSLIEALDETKTAAGARMLRRWIREPLRVKNHIEARLSVVEAFLHERSTRNKAREILGTMYDIERITSRLSVGIGTPHDLIALKNTLNAITLFSETISHLTSSHSSSQSLSSSKTASAKNKHLQDLASEFPAIKPVAAKIETTLVSQPPIEAREGGLINAGVTKELDELRDSIKDSQSWIANLEQKERTRTGIGSLKVKFNSVFGYYIEVTRSNLSEVPKDYMRKQTTVNAERFITPELQKHEEKVLHGQDLINKLEFKIFQTLISEVLREIKVLQKVAGDVASLDCLMSFAQTADHERYTKPTITTNNVLSIEDGRHPVVEKLHDVPFVPNNAKLNSEDHQLLVITGPNMAGKSVYMRQVALITLMAHIGSYVPAKRASISLIDRIFVRSGASDSIGKGLSTFMVEMVETAYILHHATPQSLIIMDEIGRGTATYDGISIAWAVAEYLVTHKDHAAKTLFATHYHELQDLEQHHPDKIKNYHMAIEESGSNPVFLYRLTKGGAHGSYAIAVAKLAGVPAKVTDRASELLKKFDTGTNTP